MKTMIATFGICLAMAVAGCAQKADTNTTLAAFDDAPSTSCCASKTAATGCPMTAKMTTASASTCSKTAASSGCCASKKMMTTNSDTVSN